MEIISQLVETDVLDGRGLLMAGVNFLETGAFNVPETKCGVGLCL